MKKIKITASIMIIIGLIAAAIGGAFVLSSMTGRGSRKQTIDDVLNVANNRMTDGNYSSALVYYQDALEMEEDNEEALRGAAQSEYLLEYYDDAIADYEKLQDMDKATEEDWLDYVNAKLALNDLDGAKETVEKLVKESGAKAYTDLYAQMEVAAPKFTYDAGTYQQYLLLELEETEDAVTVYYSTNGSDPTRESEAYFDGIVVSRPTTTIKAIAYSPLGYASDVVTLDFKIDVEPIKLSEAYHYGGLSYYIAREMDIYDDVYNYDLAQVRSLYVIGTYSPTMKETEYTFSESSYQRSNGYSAETSRGSVDLSDLQYMPFLKTLVVAYQEDFDVELLGNCMYLENLSLCNNGITDITPLMRATSLRQLSLGWNHVSDVGPLNGLVGLESLGLWNNQIQDVSSLGALSNLTYFDISNNQVSDISVVKNYESLREIWIEGNPVSDKSVLDEMESLSSIH